MSLTVYHFHFAQSDRIVWLCEELSLLIPTFKYTLKTFPRGLDTSVGKQEILKIVPAGTTPAIHDTTVNPPVAMTESQGIVMYILAVHGKGHLQPPPPGPDSPTTPQEWAQYCFWLSFANGSFQAFVNVDIYAASLFANGINNEQEFKNGIVHQSYSARTPNHLKQYETRLSKSKYLAGEEFTAADIMQIYGLTLLRLIYPIDLTEYPNIRRWLKDITSRKGYKNAMDKAEDGIPALYQPTTPLVTFEVLLSANPWHSIDGLRKLKEEQDPEWKVEDSTFERLTPGPDALQAIKENLKDLPTNRMAA
ncbi:Glutathione S-transferase 3 [Cyphellophora attinorum]|uniref:Glutathione S-transferase 3 n=1 Tax=Cyphellophora attinorum TaxID=1664694 RepID=A0A0N1P1Z0_9EURO|nr:Glutathione S-transferase 3 [Phialophora attinorum]KPI45244.1 Glutathione S-transferase 3 [Phialophora attinorum]